MAVSAFKSTSKRGATFAASSSKNAATSSAKERQPEDLVKKKTPTRRSRSVSAAVSRNLPETSAAPGISDFLIKRDNPLFSTSTSPPSPTHSDNSTIRTLQRSCDIPDDRRGRSVSRSSGAGGLSSLGRSLSRVDLGRRHRSVSRGPCGVNYESEIQQELDSRLASNTRNKKIGDFDPNPRKQTSSTANESELFKPTRKLQTWTSQHPLSPSVHRLNREDAISTSSLSGAEEKTIKAVVEQIKCFQCDHPSADAGAGGIYETVRSEVRRAVSEIRTDLENALRRKNPAIITIADVADIPPELVNPDGIELVSDIRREYAAKLEQSQERARRLRADLDVEEQRGQELSRILKEILPDPRNSDTQKVRPRRKTSIERRKMSRRLADEAMNYFDECVSISTFDSSDFSSPEDPPLSSVVTTQMGSNSCFLNGGSSSSTSHCPSGSPNPHEEFDNQTHCSLDFGGSIFTATSSFSSIRDANPTQANGGRDSLADYDTLKSGNDQFSFACEPLETLGDHDLRSYIKKFGKALQKVDAEQVNARSNYNSDDYELTRSAESLLFEKMILKRRIDFGGLLVCDIRIF